MPERNTRLRGNQIRTQTVETSDLEGGVASPGNNKYYGTNSGGVKGFHDMFSVPAGSDTQVQFNDGGVMAGDSDFVFNKTTNFLTIGAINITNVSNTGGLKLNGALFLWYKGTDATNLFLGWNAGSNNITTGYYNTCLGYAVAGALTTANQNVFIGAEAGKSQQTGNNNVIIGYYAGAEGTGRIGCTFVGQGAGRKTTGQANVFIGSQSGYGVTTAIGNVMIGLYNSYYNNAGWYNCAMGYETLLNLNAGGYNVAVGRQAGYNLSSGSYNVFIGQRAGYNETTITNKLHIANTETKTLIYGDFSSNYVNINTKLGVGLGSTAPTYSIEAETAGTNSTTRCLLTTYNDQTAYNSYLYFQKSHNDTQGTLTDVIDTEVLGLIYFLGVARTNTGFYQGAKIQAIVDGTESTFVPTNLILSTWHQTSGENTNQLVLHHDGGVGINTFTPSIYADLTLENGVLCLKETTTPTADADYGKIYFKNDNKMYCQTGDGIEHEIAFV